MARNGHAAEGYLERCSSVHDESSRGGLSAIGDAGLVKLYIIRDVAEDGPWVHDYLDMGIDSPRGEAVEAALEYARWVDLCNKPQIGKTPKMATQPFQRGQNS